MNATRSVRDQMVDGIQVLISNNSISENDIRPVGKYLTDCVPW
ncbi:MAG: hypothetical protein AABN33_25620 [Acidobacteriota bacterium]